MFVLEYAVMKPIKKCGLALLGLVVAVFAWTASSATCSLPEADPDPGGVSFDFAEMSARRFSSRRSEPPVRSLSVSTLVCDELDGTFALSEGQVGEIGFVVWTTNETVRAEATNLILRLELPSGVRFEDSTFVCREPTRTKTSEDGASATTILPCEGFRPSGGAWWSAHYVLLSAARGVGDCGTGRLVVSGNVGGECREISSKPVRFVVVPKIRTARPKRYANGSFCGHAFALKEESSIERLAAFMGDAGVSWLIPSSAVRYPALKIWRRNGFRIVTPNDNGACANGYQLGDGRTVPWTDRFHLFWPMEDEFRWLEERSVCPLSVIERTDYCRDVVEPGIVRQLQDGVDGLWVNWEPYMYQRRGCGCERCGRAFAQYLGRPWIEIYPHWPSCAFTGGTLAREGVAFRSWLHGRMVRRLDSCVRAATGGERSLGLIPGVHFGQLLSGWRRSSLMDESRPIDFAASLRWINPWGPYLPWHAFLPYEEERGRYVGHWVAFSDMRRAVDRDYSEGHRPQILSAPQGTCGDWLTEPESFELMLDACFFNGLDACCPWTFPVGADARYWSAFAQATGRAAKYEDFVFGGTNVGDTTGLRTVPEYAAPVRRVLRNMPWARNVPQLLGNAYERDGRRIVAAFNCWPKGEAFVSLRCSGMADGKYEVVSDDGVLWAKTRQETSYDPEELAFGISVVVGAARCRVFEIRPVGSEGPTQSRSVMTAERFRLLYASRRKDLERAAARDAKLAESDGAGMIRYD